MDDEDDDGVVDGDDVLAFCCSRLSLSVAECCSFVSFVGSSSFGMFVAAVGGSKVSPLAAVAGIADVVV